MNFKICTSLNKAFTLYFYGLFNNLGEILINLQFWEDVLECFMFCYVMFMLAIYL